VAVMKNLSEKKKKEKTIADLKKIDESIKKKEEICADLNSGHSLAVKEIVRLLDIDIDFFTFQNQNLTKFQRVLISHTLLRTKR
jgi:hypothetical protein